MDDRQIILSRHARRRMNLYNITFEQIAQTLGIPDRVEPTIKKRYNAYKKIGDRYLRVTYLEEEKRYLVVSTTPRKRF